MLTAGKIRSGKKPASPSGVNRNQNNEHTRPSALNMNLQQRKQNNNGNTIRNVAVPSLPTIAEVPEVPWSRYQKQTRNSSVPLSKCKQPQQQSLRQDQSQPLPQQQQQQQQQNVKNETKKRRQKGPLPGAANQWYALSNRVHKHGTTIEMMYTGLTVPQPRELVDVRAIPGVTHVTMELPAGVLPNIRNSTPDMPSLMNAMDFFRFPEHHPPAPCMGPSTTIQVIPKDNNNNVNPNNMDSIEVVPLSCARAAPLKRSSLNVAFQSYSLMQLEVDEGQSQEPGRLVMDAEISPTYMLTTHQQLRLQAAIMQENVPLADALLPIVEDLYEEHEKLHNAGLRLVPAPIPLPYGTMRFHYIDPPLFGSPKSVPMSMPCAPPYIVEVPRGQTVRKKRNPVKQAKANNYINVGSTIMALDQNGNYQPMVFSEWSKLKKGQQPLETSEL
ncbi:uncharacterized protein LOC115764408 [Drosophila novamexicana]|uniref:uncharacterized protein LOC115764408 n=1 Tax=Drosophila novamexicana TaxID=47314 RepID=UPI0011E5CFE0|nr:uncharacterized protein LOC115764408 [Drosophila novamexicana]